MTPTVRPFWLGVDPGAQWTGFVLLDGRGELVDHHVDERSDGQDLVDWCDHCVTTGWEFLTSRRGRATDHPVDTVLAIEAVLAPSPHRNRANGNSIISVGPLLDTAAVFGAFTQLPTDTTVTIRPGHHGSQPYAVYPDALVTARERTRPAWRLATAGQSNIIRHARSAYDIARTGYTQQRLLTEGQTRG